MRTPLHGTNAACEAGKRYDPAPLNQNSKGSLQRSAGGAGVLSRRQGSADWSVCTAACFGGDCAGAVQGPQEFPKVVSS